MMDKLAREALEWLFHEAFNNERYYLDNEFTPEEACNVVSDSLTKLSLENELLRLDSKRAYAKGVCDGKVSAALELNELAIGLSAKETP